MTKRVALITGATRGLGRATALALAEEGFTVIGTGRSLAAAELLASDAAAAGLDIVPEHVDIGSDDQVTALFARLAPRFPNIDVLINNAGAVLDGDHGSALTVPASVIAAAININTLGAYRMCQQVIPRMNAAGYGRVVNLTSGMGALTDMGSGNPAYRISKTALHAVTVQFDHATVGNVKVNAVCPGWVRTDMGGAGATRSVDEGIVGILWAATLPIDGPSGGLFRDGERVPW